MVVVLHGIILLCCIIELNMRMTTLEYVVSKNKLALASFYCGLVRALESVDQHMN